MKKLSLFMLMAVGLLISTSMSAMPERPVPPTESQDVAEGVLKKEVPPTVPTSFTAAPRKAAMGDDPLMFTLYRDGSKFKDYYYNQNDYDALFGSETVVGAILDGDSLVLQMDFPQQLTFANSIVLDLNGHSITESTYNYVLYVYSDIELKVMNGTLQTSAYQTSEGKVNYAIYIATGDVVLDNVTITSKDTFGPYYALYMEGGNLCLNNCNVNGCYAGLYNSAESGVVAINDSYIYSGYGKGINLSNTMGDTIRLNNSTIEGASYAIYTTGAANVLIDQSNGGNCHIEGKANNTIYQSAAGSITLKGGTIANAKTNCVQLYAGTFTMTGGTVTTSVGHAVYQYAYYDASTINIQGGTIENTANVNPSNSNASCIYTVDSKAATVNISDGVFKPSVNSTDINGVAVYASCVGGGPKVYITGGTFYSPRTHDHIFYKVANTTFSVKGGYFEQPSIGTHISLPIGYSFLPQNEEGFYEVSNVLFTIKGKGGYTYEEVKTVWVDGDEVTLKRPTTIEDGTIVIDKSVSLNLTEYSMENLSVAAGKTVNVYGTQEASIKAFAGEGTIIVHSGTYPFDPTTYLAPGLSAQKNESKNVWVVGDGPQVSMNDVSYWTLADAFAVAPDNEQATIKLLRSVTMSKGISIDKKKNVVLELNGFTISCDEHMASSINMFVNYGTLTVQDNTDIEGKGNGTGKIAYAVENPDATLIPSSSANVFTNRGVMYVKSGAIHNDGTGLACYAIDNYANGNNAELYMTGGKLTSNASTSIRMCIFKSTKNIISIKNAVIGSLWLQENNGTEGQGYLDIEDSEILYNISLGYDKDNHELKNFSIIIKNSSVNVEFINKFNPSARDADSSYVMDNNVIRAYYVDYPYPCLTNGFYQFNSKKEYKLVSASAAKDYPEDEGWICIPDESQPGFVRVYMSAQKLLRDFYQNIIPGYGLVARPEFKKDKDGNYEPAWYEIRPQQGTTGSEDVEGHDGELGNPWHQDQTWNLTKEDVVPQDTTPVLIDHNVYVEEGERADAASIIVVPGQTLTIQEGATLIVGNGGIVFNNEDGQTPGQIIIEPGATLLDGANGIISDDMKNIVIQASETAQGTFLFDPEVSLNTHPFGTVELISRSCLRKYPNGNLVNYWHRFASPVMELIEDNFTNNWEIYSDTTGLQIAAGTSFKTQIFQWSSSIYNWERIDDKTNYCDSIVPFQGYTMLNNCTWDNTHKGGVTYTFKGNLVGNHNDDLSFLCKGYNYFGNSYTGPINIKALLEAVDNGDINRTIYIWDAELQVFRGWSFEQLLFVDDETTPASIPSMQTFVMQLLNGNNATSQIDYVNAIWNPVVNPTKGNNAPQKAQQVLDATLKINIAAANGEKDAVVIMKDGRYSSQLDNGADAEKYMNDGSVNLYAHAEFANVSTMADAEIEGTKLSLVSNDETEYIMTFSAVSGEQYAIRDNFTGSVITIAEGNTYAFSTNANSVEANRFEIVAVYSAPTDVKNISTNAAPKGIYSVTGQYVGEAQDWFNLPAGVYVMDGQKVVK